jgi:Epoxide hydrolase N terminus
MSQITHTDMIEGRIKAAPPDVMLPPATSEVTPFEIHVPQSALDDLKRRLKATRWPNRETVSDWTKAYHLPAWAPWWSTG